MNAHTLSRWNRPDGSGPWRALALAALAATAMLVAACGSNGPSSTTQYNKTLAFSRCMRSHGALGFPDPTSAGTITVTQALLNNPLVRSAAPRCRKLLPPGAAQLPAALQRKLATQALQYSACMRSHGVSNFPDPIVRGGTIAFRVAVKSAGSQPSAGPPQFQAAQRACQHLMPGA